MPTEKRRTKIVATLGPACDDPEILFQMVQKGMDVARFNFSHGTQKEHGDRIHAVRRAASKARKRVGIMLDNRGPEVRLGMFKGGSAFLKSGDAFILRTDNVLGDSKAASVTLKTFPKVAPKGSEILLDDGNIKLLVMESTETAVLTEVQNDGVIKDRKKVSVPGRHIDLPAASKDDMEDIAFGASLGMDFVAASFIRNASDVEEIRSLLEKHGSQAAIISKIESVEAISNLDEIVEKSDGVMVARGDLGVEYSVEEIPILQKRIIRKCMRHGKPVITATQMLESMMDHPRPTRAEASDVANAIFDGTDAVMLSGETASGNYPVLAVEVMAKIAARADGEISPKTFAALFDEGKVKGIDEAVTHSAVAAAGDLSASCIVTPTASGYTARMVSRLRPKMPIYAVTSHESTLGFLTACWGVRAVKNEGVSEDSSDDLKTLLDLGLVKPSDLCVITKGIPHGIPGTTNTMEIRIV